MKSLNLSKLDKYNQHLAIRQENRLNDTLAMSQVELRHLEEEEEEVNERNERNTLFDHFSSSPESFYNFTGFTIDEFKKLFHIVENSFIINGRGRKPKYSIIDQFLMFLHYLRHYPRTENLKSIFQIEPSTFESFFSKIIFTAGPKLEEELITKNAKSCCIESDPSIPECGYVVDATVQQISKPFLDWQQCAKYYSGKHSLYCLKSQVIVSIKGMALHIVTAVEGSVHDKAVFDQNIDDFTENVLDYHLTEPRLIMGDKGYQDADSQNLVTPFKGTYFNLTPDQLAFNEKLGKVRIIVENFFGRLKSRYRIIGDKYRGSHGRYEMIFKTCCALVNYELMNDHPLRLDDREFFLKHRALLFKSTEEEIQKNKEKQMIQKQRRIKLFNKTVSSSLEDSSD